MDEKRLNTNEMSLEYIESMEANILIVEDEKVNVDILLSIFGKIKELNHFNTLVAFSGGKALDIVNKKDIDLILLDIGLPDMSGYEVCKQLKKNPLTKNIPILFITSHNDDESIAKAYNLGAVDYIKKPFKPLELLARVKLNIQLQFHIKKLEYFAYYDPMTNVYNRRKFFEFANDKFENEKNNLFAVMFDIDKFKLINDTYGHAIGDIIIKKVAQTINNSLGKEDIFGRMGGEEFALLCNRESKVKLMLELEQLRNEISTIETVIDENSGKTINCTISIGITQYHEKILNLDYLLHTADEAMYEAKNTGRNKSIFRI